MKNILFLVTLVIITFVSCKTNSQSESTTNTSVEEDSILGILEDHFPVFKDFEGSCITDVEYHNLKGKVKTLKRNFKRDDLTITYDSLGFITYSECKTESKYYKNYKRIKNLVLCDVFNEKDSFLYKKVNVYNYDGTLSHIAKATESTITDEQPFEIYRESEYNKLETYNDSVIYRNEVYKKSTENNIVNFRKLNTEVPNCTKYVQETNDDRCDHYLMIDPNGQLIEVHWWCNGYISPIAIRSMYDSVGNMIFHEQRSDYYTSSSWEYTYY